MKDDATKAAQALRDSLLRIEQEATGASRVAAQIAQSTSALDGSSGFRGLVEDTSRQNELLKAAMSPSLGSTNLKALLTQVDPLAEFRQQMAENDVAMRLALQQSFRLPHVAELDGLFKRLRSDNTAIARQFAEINDSIKAAVEAMRTPWLNVAHEMNSIRGLAALQGLGQSVRDLPPFGEKLAEIMRADLGDWRDRITIPKIIIDDPVWRSAFYVERGFDPALTAFPPAAFDEGMVLAQLRGERPEPSERDEPEEGSELATEAFGRLRHFERTLREFIDEVMTRAHGPDWPRHRLPNKMCDAWREKREADIRNGAPPGPLIAYADFTDYEHVICKRDNWPLFAQTFRRPENVRESLQRLAPIRLCTMHARLLTQDDLLFLHCEVRRIYKAIDR